MKIILPFLFLCGNDLVIAEEIPAGFQEYVVLGRDSQVFDFLKAVANGERSPLSQTAMESVVTLTASLNGQKIYYDHWEDGYDDDPISSPGASTEIYTLNSGQVLVHR